MQNYPHSLPPSNKTERKQGGGRNEQKQRNVTVCSELNFPYFGSTTNAYKSSLQELFSSPLWKVPSDFHRDLVSQAETHTVPEHPSFQYHRHAITTLRILFFSTHWSAVQKPFVE